MQALINYLISNELVLIEDAVTSLNDFVETREVKLTKNFHVFPRQISHDFTLHLIRSFVLEKQNI